MFDASDVNDFKAIAHRLFLQSDSMIRSACEARDDKLVRDMGDLNTMLMAASMKLLAIHSTDYTSASNPR